MASEEEKKRQLVRVLELMIEGLAKGIYDLFEESAYALMRTVGQDLVAIMEKEMGLEIHGENPTDVLTELLRLWEDEFGYFDETSVKEIDNGWEIEGHHCKGYNLNEKIVSLGIKEPFTDPAMNSMHAILEKLNIETHMHIEDLPAVKGIKFTLTKA